jgi:hypothetical protein
MSDHYGTAPVGDPEVVQIATSRTTDPISSNGPDQRERT